MSKEAKGKGNLLLSFSQKGQPHEWRSTDELVER